MKTLYGQSTEKESMDLQRTTRVYVRMNKAEKVKFERLAKQNHTDLSELIRQLLHKAADNSKERAA